MTFSHLPSTVHRVPRIKERLNQWFPYHGRGTFGLEGAKKQHSSLEVVIQEGQAQYPTLLGEGKAIQRSQKPWAGSEGCAVMETACALDAWKCAMQWNFLQVSYLF